MSSQQQQDHSTAAAEEILRLIYGEDLQGCTASLDSIAGIILKTVTHAGAASGELLELHEKVAEAVGILSTPPPRHPGEEPANLLPLLSQRLDSIHTIVEKLHATAALIKSQIPE